MQSLRQTVRTSLQRLGIYQQALTIRRYLDPKKLPYRFIRKYKTTINGVTVQFRTDDEYSNSWFFPRYAGGRIHERTVTEKMVEEFQKSSCFLDVGTHLGWFTCLASKHMPNGVVYGFEMDDLFFRLTQKNLAANNCSNAEALNVAVCDVSGTVEYGRDISRYSSGFRLRTEASEGDGKIAVSVKSVALDDFLQNKDVAPDLIKIDVEGAEMAVLKGMKQTLQRHKPTLFLEVHPSYLPDFNTSIDEILSLLSEFNYRVYEIEDMRTQESDGHLVPLAQDAVIEDNAMLYVTAIKVE